METEEEEQRRIIMKEVFGDSSEEEEEEGIEFNMARNPNPSWERIKEINGLWLYKDFLSLQHQVSLLSSITNEGWFTESSQNQAMRFGDLPTWAIDLSAFIQEAICSSEDVSQARGPKSCYQDREEKCPLPSSLLWREPLFDQLIVNVYQPGEGICAHVDLMRFEDGIAIISLESACVMHFTRAEREACRIENEEEKDDPLSRRIPIFLNPGSLILMSGEARYLWKHEINRKPGFQEGGFHDFNWKFGTTAASKEGGFYDFRDLFFLWIYLTGVLNYSRGTKIRKGSYSCRY